jgi:agmatinase
VGAAWETQRAWFDAVEGRMPAHFEEMERAWVSSLERMRAAQVVMLGVPLDTGAGIRRGAAYGPRAIRAELHRSAEYLAALRDGWLLDLGDVLVNPHLLHDSMLSRAQLSASRKAMYAGLPASVRSTLPVSALSMLQQVLGDVLRVNPKLRVFVLGGDHSVAWPVAQVLHARHGRELGIAQPDAHTDLLPERLGVKYCFATWSFHANELLKKDRPRARRGARFLQFGIRQSGRDRAHWEKSSGIRQFWAEEILRRGTEAVIADAVESLRAAGVRRVYFSNDIDGTDEAYASATGTPAAGGPAPEFFLALIERLGREFELVGADLVEVAPELGPEAGRARTLEVAGRYALATLRALQKVSGT